MVEEWRQLSLFLRAVEYSRIDDPSRDFLIFFFGGGGAPSRLLVLV